MISITLVSIALSHTVLTSDIASSCEPLVNKRACYRTSENIIYLKKGMSWIDTRNLFLHEMGHFIGLRKEMEAEDFSYYALGIIKSTEAIQEVLKSMPLR